MWHSSSNFVNTGFNDYASDRSAVLHRFHIYVVKLVIIKLFWTNPDLHQGCQDIFI